MLNCSGNKELMEYTQFVPETAEEWISPNEGQVYDQQTIYDYMDGAAEIYKQYSFVNLYVRQYENPGESPILLEIFKMETSQDAFGIFSHIRSGEDIGIGQSSDKTDGTLSFWKDKYFIYLRSEKETPGIQHAIQNLASTIDRNLKRTGEEPELLTLLPQSGLVKNRIRYTRSFILLNMHYFIASENILNINSETDAVLALYRIKNEESYLLMVRYPSREAAENAQNTFIDFYMPEAPDNFILQTENGKWVGVLVKNSTLVILFDASTDAQTDQFLTSIQID